MCVDVKELIIKATIYDDSQSDVEIKVAIEDLPLTQKDKQEIIDACVKEMVKEFKRRL